MELRVERVEKNYERRLAVRYHDETAGRIYVVYGGCIFSMRTVGRDMSITMFGYRLRSPVMCALVSTELLQNRRGRGEAAAEPSVGGAGSPGADYLFTHHLGSASGEAPEDLVNTFDVNVRGLVLSKLFVGFPVPDGIVLRLGEVDEGTGVLRILAKPRAVNSVTGFVYHLDSASLDLTQAELYEVPQFLAKDIEDLLRMGELRRSPLRLSIPRTPVIVTGNRGLSTITVPSSRGRGGDRRRRRRNVTKMAGHVQIKMFRDERDGQQTETDAGRAEEEARHISGWSGGDHCRVEPCEVSHLRVWKVVSLIEVALAVRKGPLSWLGLAHKNPTDNLRAVLKGEARDVCEKLGPWTEIMGKSVLRPGPEMIYATVNYLLELGGLQSKFCIMEDLCNKYAAKHNIDVPNEAPPSDEMALIEELAVSILQKAAVVCEVLRFAAKAESENIAAVRNVVAPKQYGAASELLVHETSFLLNSARGGAFLGPEDDGRAATTRPLFKRAMARTDKKVSAILACIYLESRPSRIVGTILGGEDLVRALEEARLRIVDPWDKDDISAALRVLDSIVNFRLA
ncbi:tegument protein [Psittacid alphaherpesvirus 1]|uniref:Tegument protein UL21 n=1 Tax=Psittacid herpesvirus 1 (isolate Amazon parrot/-/97-0001/1997) TaxID=670426 RepID=TG21_PSHV1|nr:tegument protein UL21 [Psittacid alphaherpesvirus 1]Q6UDI6.1 RecName: Full=Tegument protein UL21 [Psittacid herpesvirus 1 Amazon parrot/1997]AAQ73724.1 tegument protein [Psittacid alphaherpesvirus 1]